MDRCALFRDAIKRIVYGKKEISIPRIFLVLTTAVLIAVLGVIFKQSFIRILPLYVSLIVGALQSRANRYAALIGGLNSILYAAVYFYLGLYASAGYALLFSFPLQIATFIMWSRKKYAQSTVFRKMSLKGGILSMSAFVLSFAGLYIILRLLNSNYQILDNLTSLAGIFISVLTMFAFVEYTWLMLPSGILNTVLNVATMKTNPEQITYVVFSVYSLICVAMQFFRVRRLYAEQQREKRETL